MEQFVDFFAHGLVQGDKAHVVILYEICAGFEILFCDLRIVAPVCRRCGMNCMEYFEIRACDRKLDDFVAAEMRVQDIRLFLTDDMPYDVLSNAAFADESADWVVLA